MLQRIALRICVVVALLQAGPWPSLLGRQLSLLNTSYVVSTVYSRDVHQLNVSQEGNQQAQYLFPDYYGPSKGHPESSCAYERHLRGQPASTYVRFSRATRHNV